MTSSNPAAAYFCSAKLTQHLSLLLAITLLAISTASTSCQAQNADSAETQTKKNPLTPKFLIGDAVSLSNQSYPEVEKAIQRFINRDVQGAQVLLEQAKEKYPKLAPTDVMMAKMQMVYRNLQGVQFYLERAATRSPEDPEAYLMLADQAFQAQRTTESLSLFEYAAPLVEKFTENSKRKRNFNIRVLAGRAAVAERRGQWEQAKGLLQQWLSIDPENALAHTRMGIVLFRLNEAKEALAEFTKAKDINPDSAHPFVSLGRLFYANDDSENARKSYEKAYNENKSDAAVAQAYVEWLIQEYELDKAQEIATALRENSPGELTPLLLDGIVAYMQGQTDRAEQTFQKVLSLDPRNARATDLMALLLIQSDKLQDKERALQYAQNNAERLANSAQANVTRAYVLYELGRKPEAQKSLQQAGKMQIQPDSTYLIARILATENQNEKAISALKKILNQKSGLIIFRRQAEELLAELEAKL